MATRVLMDISDNEGYAPEQINSSITLGDLLEQVEAAIEEFGEDASIVLSNGQRYGAGYGRIAQPSGDYLFRTADGEEEEL